MDRYQFEKIYAEMGKEFGVIRKGREEEYAMQLFPMESNALKIHRINPRANSRRMKEAIALALFDVKGRCENITYDVDKFRDEDNGCLEKALLMAFDPFENEEIKACLGEQLETMKLREYYREPVMCLLRIKDSIDTWEKNVGVDGYFKFIENHMGSQIEHDTKMNFAVKRKLEENDLR